MTPRLHQSHQLHLGGEEGQAPGLEDDVDYEPEEAPRPGKRWIPVIVILGLAAVGSASALLWRAYGNNLPIFSYFGSTAPAPGDKVVMLKDLQAFQQQITAQTQATTQLLGSQQAEIKRLSEQMTILGTKLDTLQRSVTSVQVAPIAANPAPVPLPPVRKKPAVPKPAEAPAEAPSPPPPSIR